MGSAQLLTILGGLVILSLLGLSFYNSYRTKSDVNYYNEALITASGLGESMLEQIMTRAFDEKSVSKAANTTDSLTASYNLGTDTGESTIATFDDIDDFDNYIRFDTLSVFGLYRTSVKVRYMTKMNPNSLSASRTFSKRIDIKVFNNYMGTDTVKFFHVVTY